MGCTQSKIENEEAVSRCKDRKQFMKESVSARNAFAAAHSAYAMSLKNTGAALSDYAHGEVQIHPQFSSSSAAAANSTSSSAVPVAGTQPPFESLPPPPPPLPNFPPNPLQRAASMPEFKSLKPESRPTDTIMEEEDEEEEEDEDNYEQSSSLKHRSSSQRANVGGGNRNMGVIEEQEDDGPPPPPSPPPAVMTDRAPPPMPVNKDSSWDFFWSADMPGPTLSGVEEVGINKEEIERNAFEERPKRSKDVVGWDGDGGRSGKSEATVEKVVEPQVVAPPPPPVVAKTVKKTKQGLSSATAEGKRGGQSLANGDLLKIFIDLDDHFLKASEGAHEVSKMLEATRLHYHSNFADNRGEKPFTS